jgi:hypothetical protein
LTKLELLAQMGAVQLCWKVMAPFTVPVDSMFTQSLRNPTLKRVANFIFLRGVFTDPSLGPVLYYHYVDTTIGYADGQKRFGWNQINFSSGWPVV